MPRIFGHHLIRGLLTPFIAGVVLAILAPFGTDEFGPIFRFIYWIGLTLAGGLGAMGANALLMKLRPDAGGVTRALVQSLGATLAVAPFVIGAFWSGGFMGNLLSLFYIWVIAIVITAVGLLAEKRQNAPQQDVKTAPLLERLPPKFRQSQIYAISSEDHYIRIHSDVGEHMLLMRLSDAEDLAAPIAGLKPHRSWWVAEAGIDEIVKSNGKLRIRLKSGTDVPVSREGAKRVRAANWI